MNGFPWWLSSKESACNAGDTADMGLIPGLGRSPGERKWQPTPVFLPGKSMDRGARWARVHRVTKSQTQLSTHTGHIWTKREDSVPQTIMMYKLQ